MLEVILTNLLPVACATILSIPLGFMWYGLLFCKPWMKALGIHKEDVEESGLSMTKAIVGSVLASVATALGLVLLFSFSGVTDLGTALMIGVIAWVAFSLTPMFKMIFWEDRPIVLFAIDGGYELVSIMAATLVIVLWP